MQKYRNIPTLMDVARRAGVSPSTASYIVRQREPQFSQYAAETIKRVQLAAKELGYRPNLMAVSLERRQSPFFGVSFQFIKDVKSDPMKVRPVLMWEIFRGITLAGQAHGRYPVLLTSPDAESYARDPGAIDHVIRSGLCGMIVSADPELWDAHVSRWEDAGIPCISIFNRGVAGRPRWFVDLDNRRVGSLAWEYLHAKGHSKVLCVWDHRGASGVVDRIRGFREAQRASGYRSICLRLARRDPETQEDVQRDEALLIETIRSTGATAIFATSGGVSMDVLAAMSRKGLRVPEDCSVIGIDPLFTYAEFVHLAGRMTEIICPGHELGREAANLLARRVDGVVSEPTGVLVQPEIIERESVATIK